MQESRVHFGGKAFDFLWKGQVKSDRKWQEMGGVHAAEGRAQPLYTVHTQGQIHHSRQTVR